MPKLGHPYQLGLERYRSMGLYMPADTATRSTPIGPVFQEDTASTFATPALGVTTQYRRRIHTVTAGAPNNVAGVRFNAAADFPFVRGVQGSVHTTALGDKLAIGGFYCSFAFRIETWPDNTSRFFCGLSDLAGSNMASADSTAIAASNYFGLMHDTVDGANVLNAVSRASGGARNKIAITGGAFSPPVLAAGRMFLVELIAWANQSTMSLVVYDVQEGLSIHNSTSGVNETAFTGPQCVVSNGSTGGNAPAIGIANIFYYAGE